MPFGLVVSSAAEHGLPEPAETGASFVENAELKALAAARGTGLPALADDSGLAVAALGGAPGIHSARWAGPSKDFGAAIELVRSRLEASGNPDRRAAFVAALTLAWPDGTASSFEGRVDCSLTFPPRGGKGFGYDPIFIPEGFDITFGEMEPEQKHRISHRARAFEQLVAACLATS
jgi:XTP/dITP diphosphohydrolase